MVVDYRQALQRTCGEAPASGLAPVLPKTPGHEADRPRGLAARLPDSPRGRRAPPRIGQVGLPLGQGRSEPARGPARRNGALSEGASRAVASGPGAGSREAATVAQTGASASQPIVTEHLRSCPIAYVPTFGPIPAEIEGIAHADRPDRPIMSEPGVHEDNKAATRRLPRAEANALRRLLSPDEAAKYLGLGSRWAVRRLVVNGVLPVVRIAGKWRLDVEDLDGLISKLKSVEPKPTALGSADHDEVRLRALPAAQLAPLARRGHRLVTKR